MKDFDDDFEQAFESKKTDTIVVVGISLGAIVVVVIICLLLWKFTHNNQNANAASNSAELSYSETVDNTDITDVQSSEELTGDKASIEISAEDVSAESSLWADETAESSEMEQNTIEKGEGKETEESTASQQVPSSEQGMSFLEVSDTVTAKDVTNLRSEPSTSDSENIVAQLINGESAGRTGINDDTGWSRLEYNGQTVYAVTQYLTTDMSYVPPVAPSDPNRITTQDGRVIIFENIDDYVSPKLYVNLRTEPSTSQGQATARCQIDSSIVVHRTGYSADSGWSRVEYNNEILYVVSSMVVNADAPQ